MKRKLILTISLLSLFIPLTAFAQIGDQWQIFVLGGVFSPVNDEIQNVYGDGPTAHFALASALGQRGRIKLAVNYFNQNGDPFYRSVDFVADNAGELTLTGASLSLETNPLTNKYPHLYFGAGVDYVFGKESITGLADGDGNGIGAHLSFIPEFQISQRLSLVVDATYRFLEIKFKSGRNRYQFDLSGANLTIGLGYNF